jgi:hypothetical protein
VFSLVPGVLSVTGTSTLATTTLAGALNDKTGSPGSSGYILQSTGAATQWVSTTSLGLQGASGAATVTALYVSGGTGLNAATATTLGVTAQITAGSGLFGSTTVQQTTTSRSSRSPQPAPMAWRRPKALDSRLAQSAEPHVRPSPTADENSTLQARRLVPSC